MQPETPDQEIFTPERTRDYPRLFQSLSLALSALTTGAGEQEALQDSFAAAAEGAGARKALLLAVDASEPVRLRCIARIGKLSDAQVQACERGESVHGVSSSTIRDVIQTRSIRIIEDPRLTASSHQTTAFAYPNESFSVLCAPILRPFDHGVLAVLYLQSSGLNTAFTERDRPWLETYTALLSQVFGYYLQARRRQWELELRMDGGACPADAPSIIGDSHHTLRLKRDLHDVYIPASAAKDPGPVLVLGEKGTGKELVAKYVQAFARPKAKFIPINMATVTPELAASTFFGHVRGAFTGAHENASGLFRAAHRGTIFLDEIAHLPLQAQAGLLRVLEYHQVVPVGGTEPVEVDALVILATNRDLGQLVAEGKFLDDLFDRIRTGYTIQLHPLRERQEDVLPLLDHCRRQYEASMRKRTLGFSPEVVSLLGSYAWPGNVRELTGVVRRLIGYARPGELITTAMLRQAHPEVFTSDPVRGGDSAAGPGSDSLVSMVKKYRRDLILARLEKFGGDSTAARDSLGVKDGTWRRYLEADGIKQLLLASE